MVYEIKRNGVTFFTHEVRGTRTQTAPAVDFIDIEFDYKEAVLFKKNDTIEFKGQTYYCDRQYNNENKQASKLYRQKARFVSENYRATEIAIIDAQGNSTFEIEANLLTLLTLAVTNLNRLSSGWSYNPVVPNTVTKTFEMSEENVMSFLVRMSGEFQIPFDIKDKVISFREPQHDEEGLFKYGRGNGFLDLTKTYRSGERIPNTIYATGFEGLTPEINPIVYQPDIDENGVVEGFYNNENIKPTTRDIITSGTGFNNSFITAIPYFIPNYQIQGQTPWINFETGALGGYSFLVESVQMDSDLNSRITLKRRTVDGVLLPNNELRPMSGDYFNVTNIRQPQEVIDEAKGKLLDYAYDYLDKIINRNLIIQASLDPLFTEDLNLNDKIHIVDEDLNIDGKFIINEIKEDLQNLNKKEISLDFTGFSLYSQTFTLKNENIIDVSFQNINDDLVAVEEEVSDVRDRVDINDLEIGYINNIKLPLKEDNINKVDILKITNPTSAQYPTAISVKESLNLKQNKLIQGSNISIVSDTISVPNATSSQAGAVQLFSNTTQTQPANAPTSVPNQTYGVQTNSSGQMVVNVPHVGYSDLDGFVYNVTFDSTTQVLTFFRQNQPNVVVDLPTEELIKDIEIVTVSGVDYLRLWFQDGTYRDVPLNTLLVGVVKSVNGLTPNSNGEVVVNIGDIPALSSTLSGKANVNGNNLTNIATWRTNLGVYSTTQVDTLINSKVNGLDGVESIGLIGGSLNDPFFRQNGSTLIFLATKSDIPSLTGYVTQTSLTTQLNDKVDKVAGKQLSTEDYTSAEKTKLSGIQSGAEVNVNADWNATSGDAQILNKPSIPTVGNGQLSFTVPTGLVISGTFNANQSGNTTIPITWQAGYQGFTTAESNKLSTVENNATRTRITGDGDNFVSGDTGVYGEGGTESRQDGTKIYLSQSSFRTEFYSYTSNATVPNNENDKVIQKGGSSAVTLTIPNGQRNGQKMDLRWGGTSNFTINGNLFDAGGNLSTITVTSNATRINLVWNANNGRWWLT